MYIKDGIAYAGEPAPCIEVRGVRTLPDHKLWLRFSTGEQKIFDFVPELEHPCFAPLRDEKIFREVYIDYSVTVWQGGDIDIAPEYLYKNSVPACADDK